MKRMLLLLLVLLLPWLCSGCLLTRLFTMPLRVGGAALTIIPVAGDAAHEAIDEASDVLDEIPL